MNRCFVAALVATACAPTPVPEAPRPHVRTRTGTATPAPELRSGPVRDASVSAALRAHLLENPHPTPVALRIEEGRLVPVPSCELLDRVGRLQVLAHPSAVVQAEILDRGAPPPSTTHVLADGGPVLPMNRTHWDLRGPVLRRGDCDGVTHATTSFEVGIRLEACEEAQALSDPADAFAVECPRDLLAFEAGPIALAPAGEETTPLAEPMVYIAGGSMEGESVAGFWLDRDEVSHDAFARCARAGTCNAGRDPQRPGPMPGGPAHASLANAALYCKWVGKRLPTLTEWMWAARGRDEARTSPWGEAPPDYARVSAIDADHERSVSAADLDSDDPRMWRIRSEGAWHGLWRREPDACGSRPLGQSRDGVRDLVGNMREVVRDVRPGGSVRRFAVGASFRNRLPDHSDLDLGEDPDPESLAFVERELRALTVAGAVLEGAQMGGGHTPTMGVRCAADDPPPEVRLQPSTQTIEGTEIYAPLGLRQYAEAASLCDERPGQWSVATAEQLAAVIARDDPRPWWTDDGRIFSTRTGPYKAEPNATAFVACLRP